MHLGPHLLPAHQVGLTAHERLVYLPAARLERFKTKWFGMTQADIESFILPCAHFLHRQLFIPRFGSSVSRNGIPGGGRSSRSYQSSLCGLSLGGGVMTFVSTCLVVARFISRSLTISIKWDDWFCLFALIFAYGFLCTTALVATVGHSGYHITQYTDPLVLEKFFQITLANNVIYNVSVGLTKISILLFYQRIFAINKTFLLCTWVVAGLSVGACLAAVFGLIFSSSPVEAQWKFWMPSTTIHNKSFWIAMGIVNILLDATILALPQPVVWRLHQTRRRRILLSLVFSLGGFVCLASIIRLIYMATVDISDLTYTFVTPGIWTMVEMNMSIICACLPVIPNLVQHVRTSRSTVGASTGWSSMAYLRAFRSNKSGFSAPSSIRSHTDGSRQGLYTDIETANTEGNNYHLGDVSKVHVKMDLQQNWDPVKK